MKIVFMNPPSTTSLYATPPGKYVDENIGIRFLPISKIPFEVMAKLDSPKRHLTDMVMEKEPDIILTEAGAQASLDTLDWITTELKSRNHRIILIAGGQAVTHLQEKIFTYCPNLDAAFQGNADVGLPLLIRRIRKERRIFPGIFHGIEGAIYRSKGSFQKNPIRDEYITRSREMFTPFSSLLTEAVAVAREKEMQVMMFEEFTQGCQFSCDFCAARMEYHEKEMHKVIASLDYLYSLGIFQFYITDLTFGAVKRYRENVLSLLIQFKKEHPLFRFRCVTRFGLITPNFASALFHAGCYEVGLGIESPDIKVLIQMRKLKRYTSPVQSVSMLSKERIQSRIFLIEGYPGSDSRSSQKTFRLLENIDSNGFSFFIQPALSREIIPCKPRFKEMESRGILKRGTINQLDFRHDCRKNGLDTDTALRAICSLILAYPSTELGRNNRDRLLQHRLNCDIPFFIGGIRIKESLKVLDAKNPEEYALITDAMHFIDGAYTIDEIIRKLYMIHVHLNKKKLRQMVNHAIAQLRKECLVDSFGKPNLNIRSLRNYSNDTPSHPSRHRGLLLFWNGDSNRYLYFPNKKDVVKIKTCFYRGIPEDVFDFLHLTKGIYNLDKISERMACLFSGEYGFSSKQSALHTTQMIYKTCKKNSLCR